MPEEGDEQYDDEVESGEEGDKQEIVVVEDDDDEVYDEDDGGQSGRDPPAEFEEEEGDEPDVLEGEEFEGEEEVNTTCRLSLFLGGCQTCIFKRNTSIHDRSSSS